MRFRADRDEEHQQTKENAQEMPSLAYDLAQQIDEFMYGYNRYEYQDQVPDRGKIFLY